MTNFDNTPFYSIVFLKDDDEHTDLIIDGNHHKFSDILLFKSIDECMTKYQKLLDKKIPCFVLNNHALLARFCHHQLEEIKEELGIQGMA